MLLLQMCDSAQNIAETMVAEDRFHHTVLDTDPSYGENIMICAARMVS